MAIGCVWKANPFAPNGRPQLDGVDWHLLASSNTASTSEALLRTGEVDLIVNLPVTVREHLAADGFPTGYYPVDGVTALELNHRNPYLRRVEVRTALRLATDRRAIAAKAIRSAVQETLDSPVDAAYAELPFVERDVRAANDLLDRAGLRRDPRGTRFSLDLVYVESPRNAATVELLRADWAEIGVALQTRHVELSLYLAPKDRGGIMRGGRYDVGIVGRSPVAGVAAMDSWFGCHGGNWNNYCSPRIDALIADAYGALEERREVEATRAVYRQLDREVPVITLAPRMMSHAANRVVSGFRPTAITTFDDVSSLALRAG